MVPVDLLALPVPEWRDPWRRVDPLTVRCVYCEAAVGERCASPGGTYAPSNSHAGRWEDAGALAWGQVPREVTRPTRRTPCPVCGSTAGGPMIFRPWCCGRCFDRRER